MATGVRRCNFQHTLRVRAALTPVSSITHYRTKCLTPGTIYFTYRESLSNYLPATANHYITNTANQSKREKIIDSGTRPRNRTTLRYVYFQNKGPSRTGSIPVSVQINAHMTFGGSLNLCNPFEEMQRSSTDEGRMGTDRQCPSVQQDTKASAW